MSTTLSVTGLNTLSNLVICTGCRVSVVNGRISIVHTHEEGCARRALS